MKGVGGKERLTDKVIKIRENKEDLKGMKTSISAILIHMVKSEKLPLKQQHKHCPKSPNIGATFGKINRTKLNFTMKIVVKSS